MNPLIANQLGIISDSDYQTLCCLGGIIVLAVACIVLPIYVHDLWQKVKRK